MCADRGFYYSQGQPTIKHYQGFDPKHDAEVLRKAMKGLGTDEKAIIAVLTKRSNIQRQEISKMFKTLYGKDLIKELKGELSGRFEDLIVALMYPPADYDADQLMKAVKGLGTHEGVLIEILCTRTNHELHAIKDAFRRMFGKDLEKEVASDTSGHFKRLMVSLCQANRNENPSVDGHKASEDARRLYSAGKGQWGTDESVFNEILISQSIPQLRQIYQEYERQAGCDIMQSIKSEMSGYLEDGFLAVVKSTRNHHAYFAERLHHAMEGAGTHDQTLIRVIVSRSEIDLENIKQLFPQIYGKSLENWISHDTSGDYKKALLSIVEGN